MSINCPQGHPYNEENTYVDSRGTKNCRICNCNAVKNPRVRRLVAGFCMTCGKASPKAELKFCQNCLDKMTGKAREAKHGVSDKEYQQMLIDQSGVCAICKTPSSGRALGLDHDHKTGAVRGLLCLHCNTGIGNFRDDIDLLDAARKYIANG